MNVKQGIIAAENLKKRMRETLINSASTSPTITSLSPSPSMIPHDDCKLNDQST
jgi:hypothetical protein